ncbi:MAG: hypothetical protein RLZZ403_1281 [Pseudomonadota bacterium]|jgi:hypothetical protein
MADKTAASAAGRALVKLRWDRTDATTRQAEAERLNTARRAKRKAELDAAVLEALALKKQKRK